jgi:hypothetical protein
MLVDHNLNFGCQPKRAYLDYLLRLLRNRDWVRADVDVDVIGGICHISVHGGGRAVYLRAIGSACAGCRLELEWEGTGAVYS